MYYYQYSYIITQLNNVRSFCKPPSIEELEKRLKARGTETEDSLGRRLEAARKDMEYGDAPGNFDLVIVNDDLSKAVNTLEHFLQTAYPALQS
jgi:guanylate kinase